MAPGAAVRLGEELGPSRGHRLHLGDDERAHERVLRREVAVDGPDADAGAARDVLHLRVEPVLGEAVAGGGDDLVAVALRVGAERAGGGVGRRHMGKSGGTGVPLPLWSMRPGTGAPLHLNRTAGAFPPMTDAAPTKDRRWLALALLAAAQFVVVLDA